MFIYETVVYIIKFINILYQQRYLLYYKNIHLNLMRFLRYFHFRDLFKIIS